MQGLPVLPAIMRAAIRLPGRPRLVGLPYAGATSAQVARSCRAVLQLPYAEPPGCVLQNLIPNPIKLLQCIPCTNSAEHLKARQMKEKPGKDIHLNHFFQFSNQLKWEVRRHFSTFPTHPTWMRLHIQRIQLGCVFADPHLKHPSWMRIRSIL